MAKAPKKRDYRPYRVRDRLEPTTIASITPGGQGAMGSTNEQGVVSDLMREAIGSRGNDYLYLPRKEGNLDNLFGEDTQTELKKAIPMRMYLENVEGLGGSGYSLSLFGLHIDQTATLVVSKDDWFESTRNSNLKNKYGEARRPFERDFIWDRTTSSLFEILFVEKQNPFYVLGHNHIYKLDVKLAQYNIDRISQDHDASDPNLGADVGELQSTHLERSLGVQHQANGVMRLSVESGGTYYTNENIRFIFVEADGETSENIVEPKINESSILIKNGSLVSVAIEHPGSGYTLPPTVEVIKADADDFGEEAVVKAVLNSAETKTPQKEKGVVAEEGDSTDSSTPKIKPNLIVDSENPYGN